MTFRVFWIIVNITIAYAISIDCPDMINLGFGLGIKTQQPAIWTQLNGDCCTATGVNCVGQRVTNIDWSGKNLNGVINATALQIGLQHLYLNSNQITGSIPDTWQSQLVALYLHDNQLTGSISRTWPSGLLYLALHNNYLTGDISFVPSLLIVLYLGLQGDVKYNHFTGKLILKQPQFLYIYNHWITDVVVYDPIFLSGYCDLSNTPLLGNPHISNLTMCVQSGLYSANLLPYTMSSSVLATNPLISKASALSNTFFSSLEAISTSQSIEKRYTSIQVQETERSILKSYRTTIQSTSGTELLRNSFLSILTQSNSNS